MNILIIGLGSMGQRRLRIIQENYPKYQLSGVEFAQERREDVMKKYGIPCYASIEEAVNDQKYDAAFVCTPPKTHADIIVDILSRGINVFTELNLLSNRYDEIISLSEEKNLKIFMSSTLLYRKEIQIIDQLVKKKGPLMYIYHMGQYLPDWHPWECYKNFFVGNKETNGCREIFAIQLPWILKVFGNKVNSIYTSKKKITKLELDYPDSYLVMLEHNSGNRGCIAVDIVSRKATTYLEIIGEDVHIKWDGTPNGLMNYNFETKSFETVHVYDSFEQNENYAATIIEDAYAEEVKCFFDYLTQNIPVSYDLHDDYKTLSLINMIENQ